jgi:hypothetical protein
VYVLDRELQRTLRNSELYVLDEKDVKNLTSIAFVLLLYTSCFVIIYERIALHMGGMTRGPLSMPRELNFGN